MPLPPLPVGPTDIDGGDLPVSDASDVLTEFSRPHRNADVAPVRDAFASAFAEGFKEYQNVAAYAADQTNPLLATGDYLASFAEERQIVPRPGESNEDLRARLFETPDIVTPDVIVAGVNEILAPYSTIGCHLSELELDGWFVHDGTAGWDAFIGTEPNYPDRYYDDVPSLLPGGCVPSWGYPRSFLLRIPPLETSDELSTYILDGAAGTFVGDGSDTSGSESSGAVAMSVYGTANLADEIYSSIVGFVERIKGQGISWGLIVDPELR